MVNSAMKTRFVSLGLFLIPVFVGCDNQSGDSPPQDNAQCPERMPYWPDKALRPAVAIYRQPGHSDHRRGIHRPQVILAIWSDGTVIWSHDWLKGGPPYYVGQIQEGRLKEAISLLQQRGIFTVDYPCETHITIDASYIIIAILAEGHRLEFASSHELFEDDPRLVCTDYGVTSLDGRDREAVLQSQSRRYREFRKNWSILREILQSLIPKHGKAARKGIEFESHRIVQENTTTATGEMEERGHSGKPSS